MVDTVGGGVTSPRTYRRTLKQPIPPPTHTHRIIPTHPYPPAARQGVLWQHRMLQQHVLLLLLLLRLRALQQQDEVVVHRKPSDRVVGGS